MREALSTEKLKSIYDRIARHYDFQHTLLTARADQRGRRILVEAAVNLDNNVLDCGAGTGTTGLQAAQRVGERGHVTLFDLSEEMLGVARQKADKAGLGDRLSYQSGDMLHLPFASDSFDAVLSTYSLCPLYDPEQGAMELYRVTKPGGKIAIAHSTEPRNPSLRWLAERVENLAWRFPGLSMGCRAVNVLPMLAHAGGIVIFTQRIGVPLWPFQVFMVEKPIISDKG